MFKRFKIFAHIMFTFVIPFWVFGQTGIDLTGEKLLYLYRNMHNIDIVGLLVKHHFALIVCMSLWLNLCVVLWSIPIMSWIKSTRH